MSISRKSSAQLIVSDIHNPERLVKNVLIGPGITVTNIAFAGDTTAIASFNGANSNIGLENGIIMSTGKAKDARGPNNRNVGTSNNKPGDGNLDIILTNGEQTVDAAVIEFDFIPTANNLTFRIVFASEEYPSFINQGFNDVFGFFISGPGFSGQENIALVPGTNTPISIKSINPFVNSQYYINNENGTTVQYNGFTSVIEISINVEACKEYHIKLAIADVKDPIFDSGIFIEAGSFSSINEKEVSIQRTYPPVPDLLSEGCDSAVFLIRRLGPNTQNALNIGVQFSGLAQHGIDYTSNVINQNISIPGGTNSVKVVLRALQDGLTEGLENVIVELIQPEICKVYKDSVVIKDYFPPIISTFINVGCRDDRTLYTVLYKNGSSNLNIAWHDSAGNLLFIGENASLELYEPGWVYVTITDECTGVQVKDSVYITPLKPIPLSMPSTVTVCPGSSFQIPASIEDSTVDFNIKWKPSTGLSSDSILNPIVHVSGDITYTLQLTYPGYCPIEVSFTLYALEMGMPDPLVYICKGDSTFISATGGHIYKWTTLSGDEISNEKDIALYTDTSIALILSITDTLNVCSISDSIFILVDTIPHADAGEDKITCLRQTITLFASGSDYNTYEWFPKSSIENPFIAYPKVTPLITTTYYVKAINRACFSFDSVTVYVVPSSSADIELLIDTCARTIHARNKVDSMFYYWDLGDGTISTEQSVSHKYTHMGSYTLTHLVNADSPCENSTFADLHFNLSNDSTVRIPNAFSPNDDGRYDYFSPVGERIYCEIERMMIFDRWGLMVFDSQQSNSLVWDGRYKGKRVTTGAYVYVIQGKGFTDTGTISVIY